jgi:hypothetical protein
MNDIGDVIGDVDLNGIEPMKAFDPVPAGWYPVEIEQAEVKSNKAGNGKYLKLAMVILGEVSAGRKLFSNLNIANPNQQAVEIALRELASIGQALGLATIKDSSSLIGGQLLVKVVIRSEKDREPDNEIKGYKSLNETAAPAAAAPAAKPAAKPTAATPATPAKAAAGKRPWEK